MCRLCVLVVRISMFRVDLAFTNHVRLSPVISRILMFIFEQDVQIIPGGLHSI